MYFWREMRYSHVSFTFFNPFECGHVICSNQVSDGLPIYANNALVSPFFSPLKLELSLGIKKEKLKVFELCLFFKEMRYCQLSFTFFYLLNIIIKYRRIISSNQLTTHPYVCVYF